jgi:hypothetical protein
MGHLSFINKWKPYIIKQYNNLDNNSLNIILPKLSMFMEIYYIIDEERPILNSPTLIKPEKIKPYGWIDFNTAVDMLKKIITHYIEYSLYNNYEIIKEYYNIITDSKTYLLKDINNNESIMNIKLKEKAYNHLLSLIDEEILFILKPDERINIIRIRKIEKVLAKQ